MCFKIFKRANKKTYISNHTTDNPLNNYILNDYEIEQLKIQSRIDYINNYSNIIKFNKKFKSEECCICLDKFKKKDKIRMLKCAHKFHDKCILDWLANHDTCPKCNIEFN
tara:strand:- start:97 stop:426 length:330 start_codon:yes stop_codon:yes gene_type:complete